MDSTVNTEGGIIIITVEGAVVWFVPLLMKLDVICC
jgi:hypothetical protein